MFPIPTQLVTKASLLSEKDKDLHEHYSQLNCSLRCEWEMCYKNNVYVDVQYITMILLLHCIQIQTLVLFIEQPKTLKSV